MPSLLFIELVILSALVGGLSTGVFWYSKLTKQLRTENTKLREKNQGLYRENRELRTENLELRLDRLDDQLDRLTLSMQIVSLTLDLLKMRTVLWRVHEHMRNRRIPLGRVMHTVVDEEGNIL